ncbi:MAG: hypothetical protein ACRDPG_06295 [Nocardioidaceae bacterium]
MYFKHNVTDKGVWSFVIQAPGCGSSDGGYSRKYLAWVTRFICSQYGCVGAEERKPLLIQEYNSANTPDGKPFGAVTLYCIINVAGQQGELRPDWVNGAVPTTEERVVTYDEVPAGAICSPADLDQMLATGRVPAG